MTDKIKGYGCAIISATTYGMIPLFTLPLYSDGMNPDSVLFFRYLVGAPFMAAMLFMRGRNLRITLGQSWRLAVLGILMGLSSLFLFFSYKYMDAGLASTVLFVYPIIVAIIMATIFKERIKPVTVMCMLAAVFGICLLYHGGSEASVSGMGLLLVGIASLTYALYIVLVNRFQLDNMAPLKVTFYIMVFGALLFGVRIIASEPLTMPTQWYMWLNVAGLALFPTCVSFLTTTSAVKYIGATPTAILGSLEPTTALFFGITVFGQVPTLRDWVGVVIIITSVTLIVAEGNITKYLLQIRRLFPSLRKKRNSSV